MAINNENETELVEVLSRGGVAVVPTDTIYGLVARANDEAAVERLYKLRQRDANKPCVVLLSEPTEAYDHSDLLKKLINKYADRPTSFVILAPSAPDWLRRSGDTIAYRVPKIDWLKRVLTKTGPLIAPSANIQGQPPAMNIATAKLYFGDKVDFYIDGGEVSSDTAPSRIIKLSPDSGNIELLR